MRVCRPRRTRGRKSHFAKTRTEKNSSRMDKCVGRGCRTTRRIRWDKRNSRRVGSGKEGSRERMGSSFGIFVRFTKRSIVRVFAHENRKSSAKTTARFRKPETNMTTPPATEAVGNSRSARPPRSARPGKLPTDTSKRKKKAQRWFHDSRAASRGASVPRPLARRAARHARRDVRLARIRASAERESRCPPL